MDTAQLASALLIVPPIVGICCAGVAVLRLFGLGLAQLPEWIEKWLLVWDKAFLLRRRRRKLRELDEAAGAKEGPLVPPQIQAPRDDDGGFEEGGVGDA